MTGFDLTDHLLQRKKAYSAAALAFLAASAADAQVVLTDIDPDLTFNGPDGVFFLDLDNDGTDDFIFSASSAAAYVVYGGGTNIYKINGVFGSPYGSNEIQINSAFSGFAYPAVVNSMDMIGSSDNFSGLSFQTLAYSFLFSDGAGLTPVELNGEWLGGTDGKYVGLKLRKDGADHYGWLRLDVGSDNKSFTVSMYAYEATQGTGITAITTGFEEVAMQNWNIYSYGTVIHLVQTGTGETGLYQVFDLQGNLLLDGSASGAHSSANAGSFSNGLYLVRLQTNSGTLTKKIFIGR